MATVETQHREIPAVPGIYAIVHIESGKRYVGSSDNIKRRIKRHLNKLESKKHENQYLQKAWTKYGASAFNFNILELCSISDLLTKEQQHIDCQGDFNLCPVAGTTRGLKHTNESKKRESEASLIRWKDANYRKIISECSRLQMQNNKELALSNLNSPAARAKANKTRWTAENRKKFGEESRERFKDEKYRSKIINGLQSCQEARVARLREKLKNEDYKKKAISGMQSEAGQKRHAEIMATPRMREIRRIAALQQWAKRRLNNEVNLCQQ